MNNDQQIPSFNLPQATQGSSADEPVKSDPVGLPGSHSALPSMPQDQSMGNTSQQQATDYNPGDQYLIAGDNDVIEKEWVDRAKKIISLTSHDPYAESYELNKLKSVYLKKRFDKDAPKEDKGSSK
ncbi:hypothetical protein KC930_02965 [Candidatus Saccharibacteria bacterium]|nr:hypothetical protein [Candidatus Saccharibacteria bacterium]